MRYEVYTEIKITDDFSIFDFVSRGKKLGKKLYNFVV